MSSLASADDAAVPVSGARLGGGGSFGSDHEQKLDDERGGRMS